MFWSHATMQSVSATSSPPRSAGFYVDEGAGRADQQGAGAVDLPSGNPSAPMTPWARPENAIDWWTPASTATIASFSANQVSAGVTSRLAAPEAATLHDPLVLHKWRTTGEGRTRIRTGSRTASGGVHPRPVESREVRRWLRRHGSGRARGTTSSGARGARTLDPRIMSTGAVSAVLPCTNTEPEATVGGRIPRCSESFFHSAEHDPGCDPPPLSILGGVQGRGHEVQELQPQVPALTRDRH